MTKRAEGDPSPSPVGKPRIGDDAPAPYSIRFVARAAKEVAKLDPRLRARIGDALRGIMDNPRGASGVKPMKGRDAYRLRVGDYRAIFEVEDNALVVLVVRVGHRKEVYR